MTVWLIVVHAPHKDWIETWTSEQAAENRWSEIVDEIFVRYNYEKNLASKEHCKAWKYCEISLGYFAQVYESEINKREEIPWLKQEQIRR